MDAVTMDTEMDVLAKGAADREATRQRSQDLIEEVERMLAEPRDPEVVRRAAEWQREHERRRAEEQAEKANATLVRSSPAETNVSPYARTLADTGMSRQPAPAPAPVTYVTRKTFDGYMGALEKAVGRMLRQVAEEAERKAAWRLAEAERRIADLKARLTKLEGRADG